MKNSQVIRVLLVDDSPIALKIMSKLLSSQPNIEIVETAKDGMEALELIPKVKPTIICTDYYMPKMNGLELTSYVMKHFPTPILVVSNVLDLKNSSKEVFSLLAAGALDVIEKPRRLQDDSSGVAFLEKIRILNNVYVFRKTESGSQEGISSSGAVESEITKKGQHELFCENRKVIVIGASTGGPSTLLSIFKELPNDFPIPIVCIQHISKGFLKGFIDWLQQLCPLQVEMALEHDLVTPGKIYLAPEGKHLKVNEEKKFKFSIDPPYEGERPSVSVTMSAFAKYYGKECIGILLTGIGKDGASGLEAIKNAGGVTIAQNEETSVVFGMPAAAIAMGAAKFIMSPQEITFFLKKLTRIKQRT